jgi:type II restriction enzyme
MSNGIGMMSCQCGTAEGAGDMDLSFHAGLADTYKSPLQRTRVLSEHWVGSQAYCPNCGCSHVTPYPNNSRVADFFCPSCDERYELKSQRRTFGNKVVDGSYPTMIDRLAGGRNPNFILLAYDPNLLVVRNLFVLPKHFFTPDVIERKRTLPATARRPGWTGCNVVLSGIPVAGRISLVQDGVVVPKVQVLATWRRTLFLREQNNPAARGWLVKVMRCIENLHQRTFSIDQIYRFEDELRHIYPRNRHIKPKIRQQLQVLRDKGYIEFAGRGNYRLADASVGQG